MKIIETVKRNVTRVITIALGSSSVRPVQVWLVRAAEYGMGLIRDFSMPVICVDGNISNNDPPVGGPDSKGAVIPNSSILVAAPPDRMSINNAERARQLDNVEKSWVANLGSAIRGNGAIQKTQIGVMLSKFVRNDIRNQVMNAVDSFREYDQQWRTIKSDPAGTVKYPAIPVIILLSAIGGMGTGLISKVVRIVYDVGEQYRVRMDVEIYVLALDPSSEGPANTKQARQNGTMLYWNLEQEIINNFSTPSSGAVTTIDHTTRVTVLAGINQYGQIGDFKNAQRALGDILTYLYLTDMGVRLDERIVDVVRPNILDPSGSPLAAGTIAISKHHFDRQKAFDFSVCSTLKKYYEWLRVEPNREDLATSIQAACLQLRLVESESDSSATEAIVESDGAGGGNLNSQANAIFKQGFQNAQWWDQLGGISDAFDSVVTEGLPNEIIPAIEARASEIEQEAAAWIGQKYEVLLTPEQGIMTSQLFLKGLLSMLAQYENNNESKLVVLQAAKDDLDVTMNEFRMFGQDMAARNRCIQALNYLKINKAATSYVHCGESLLRILVEIEARVIWAPMYQRLKEKVLLLYNEALRIATAIEKKSDLIKGKQELVLNKQKSLSVPVGLELADKSAVIRHYNTMIANKGGLLQVLDELCSNYHSRFGSLRAFIQEDENEIDIYLEQQCDEMFCGYYQAIHIMGELRMYCNDDDDRIQELVTQHIRESQGQLYLQGEAQKKIDFIMVLGVPDEPTGTVVKKLITNSNVGKTTIEVVVTGDLSSIVFMQYRGSIPMKTIIDQLGVAMTDEEKVKTAVDPYMALAPSSPPSQIELEGLLAKAKLLDVIEHDQKAGYGMVIAGNRFELGNNIDDAMDTLRKSRREGLAIHSMFMAHLRNNPSAVRSKLKACREALRGGQQHITTELVTEAALDYIEGHIHLLKPYLR